MNLLTILKFLDCQKHNKNIKHINTKRLDLAKKKRKEKEEEKSN